jgi:hypothetical protein
MSAIHDFPACPQSSLISFLLPSLANSDSTNDLTQALINSECKDLKKVEDEGSKVKYYEMRAGS